MYSYSYELLPCNDHAITYVVAVLVCKVLLAIEIFARIESYLGYHTSEGGRLTLLASHNTTTSKRINNTLAFKLRLADWVVLPGRPNSATQVLKVAVRFRQSGGAVKEQNGYIVAHLYKYWARMPVTGGAEYLDSS